MDLDVLLDDPPVLVLNKPGGLLTQAPAYLDSMERRVRELFRQQQEGENEGRVYVGVPHRLDRPASGALVVGRNLRATQRLSEQFAGRVVEKVYWALVQGRVEPDSGTWQDFMRKVPGEARAEKLDADHPDARLGVLHYHVCERSADWTRLEIRLETGRTHQIRLQCGLRGYPILGDSLYGATLPFGPVTDDERARWIALHARRLTFSHTKRREPVQVVAPLPVWWNDHVAEFAR